MNIELLNQVKEAIVAHPDQFVMSSFFSDENSIQNQAGGCGTAACIAGWAIFLESKAKTLKEAKKGIRDKALDVGYLATKAIDITNRESVRLFYISDWPEPLYQKWINAISTQGKAAVAAERIDHFIEKGE